ncbi:MAG: glycosyltransferase family 4 protein [Gemmatimonadetes bacterium]|nr:glycosyltransferase family 4 protein [Gemmatimonadota bacterium]
MNIVVHCVYFPPEVGGLESHVHYLCRGLVARGHRVTVVTSLSRPGLPRFEIMDGIHIHRTVLPARKPWGWFVHAAGSTGRTRELVQDADVVHAQAFPSLLPCALALAGTDTPLVCTLHTSHFLRLAANPVVRGSLGKLIELSDHNFAASKEIADVGEGLNDSVSVEVVVNGVDTGVFAPVPGSVPRDENRHRLVVPRRLFPKNGVEFFVRALPVILAGVDVDVIVIGDGPERERLEGLAAALGVAARIDFLGARLHAEMPALLSSADLAVFPSLVEATSVAALESMACGLPVAASAVGGLPEIIDDDVGGLFAPGDPEALAAGVLKLLASPDGLRERGIAARERVVARWSNERLVDRHLDVYRQLAGRRHRHREES